MMDASRLSEQSSAVPAEVGARRLLRDDDDP